MKQDTQIVGVIGDPISHSLSPILHQYWIDSLKINARYVAYRVPVESLESTLSGFRDQSILGFNVTIPHKQSIIPLLDVLTPEAEEVGAVNIVTFDNRGIATGHNSDGFGFLQNMRQQLKGGLPDLSNVMILGAGGAARAILFCLKKAEAEKIMIVNRDEKKASLLAEEIGSYSEAINWQQAQRRLDGVSLLVNCSSLGMVGEPEIPLSLDQLSPQMVVYDIVYRPLMTPLLIAAKQQGCTIITGLGMLIHQARPAFQQWFGIDPDIDQALLNRLQEALK